MRAKALLAVMALVGLMPGADRPPAAVAPYSDVRGLNLRGQSLGLGLILTLWFNGSTAWSAADAPLAQRVMSEGKNPGLGVRALHRRGITGKGVNVAIIDQNMCLDHPQFAGKIVTYHDTGCGMPASQGSMHGPAVTSLLVGETIGTAPGARVYYAAAPSWKTDAKYYADALNWIVAENRVLSGSHKIRLVSVSAAPSGPGSPFTKNNAAWDRAVARAESDGIVVIDCTQDHGWVNPAYYDVGSPEDVSAARAGSLRSGPLTGCADEAVAAPNCYRTQAEEYFRGNCSYQYMGQGGLSWSVPYVAGVLALGWQVRPGLDAGRMLEMLRDSAFVRDGCRIVDPQSFIERVSEWPVYPPESLSLVRLENDLIFSKEFVNRLAWRASSQGGSAAAHYRIYRRPKGAGNDSWRLLIELGSGVLAYDDRGLGQDQYFAYAVRAASAHGVESDPALAEN
jgi:serine protease AprX